MLALQPQNLLVSHYPQLLSTHFSLQRPSPAKFSHSDDNAVVDNDDDTLTNDKDDTCLAGCMRDEGIRVMGTELG